MTDSLPVEAGRAGASTGEGAWLRAARAGDREAFGRLVELHQEAVLTAAGYLSGSHEDAADIAQEVFLRAWRSIAGFAGNSSFRTWLLVITANTSRSLAARRKAKKRASQVIRLDGESAEREPIDVAEPDGRGCPETMALRRELKEVLETAIAGLDEESKTMVVLRDLLGESYESIAQTVGLPLGTVKSRIHRTRLELREKVRKYL